jgi:hypothetical protein
MRHHGGVADNKRLRALFVFLPAATPRPMG